MRTWDLIWGAGGDFIWEKEELEKTTSFHSFHILIFIEGRKRCKYLKVIIIVKRALNFICTELASLVSQTTESSCNAGRFNPWVCSIPSPLENGLATHSSILVWKILWTEKPGGLQFMGSPRVRHE